MKRIVIILLISFLMIFFSFNLHAKKLTLRGIANTGISAADIRGLFAKIGVEIKPNTALFLLMMMDYFLDPSGYNSEVERYTRMDLGLYGATGKKINDKISVKYGGGPFFSFSHNRYNYMGKEMISNKTNLGLGGMARAEYSLSDKLSIDFELGAKHIFVKNGATYITFSSGLVYIFSNK